MSGSNIQITKEQLDRIISEEVSHLGNIENISQSDELHLKLDAFISSLQNRLDTLDNPSREEAEIALQQELEQEEEVSSEQARDMAQKIIMDLEREFNVYNIKASNGIVETKASRGDIAKQVAAGIAIAAAGMWYFWPAGEQAPVEQGSLAAAPDATPAAVPQKPAAKGQQAQTEVVKQPEIVTAQPQPAVKAEAKAIAASSEQPIESAQAGSENSESNAVDMGKAEQAVAEPLSAQPVSNDENRIAVTAHLGNVRNAPDNSGKRVATVHKGDLLTKLDEKAGWYQVQLEDGTRAWAYKSLFAPRLRVAVDVANVRSKPSSSASIVARLKQGDYVTRLEEQQGWFKVQMDGGKSAWAHSSLF